MSKRTEIVVVIVLIGLAAGGYFLLRSQPESAATTTTMSKLTLAGYDQSGRVEWRVQATRGTMDKDGNGELHTVTLSLYANGKPRLTVVAPTLTFTGNQARLAGGVTATLSGDHRLTTAVVTWDKTTNLIAGPGAVTISSPDTHVTAPGFSYDPGAGRLTLTGGVTARISQPTEITATGKKATYVDGRIALADAVTIKSGNDVYTCVRAEYSNDTITLVGPVHGAIAAGKLTAVQIKVTADGSTASGNVKLLLDSAFFRGKNGA